MDLRQLRMFQAVVEQGGISPAARTLYLSPAAVSLQMKALGDELQAELFLRDGRRLVPTPAARRLLQHAHRVLDAAQALKDEFHGGPFGDTLPLVFATGLTTLVYQLGPAVRALRRQFPANEVRVVVGTTEEMVAGLAAGRYDIGLVSLPVNHPQIDVTPLFEEELLLLVPPGRKGRGRAMRPADVARLPLMLYPQVSNMRQLIDRFLAGYGIRPNVIMENDNTEALKRLVEAGFGASILPERALRERGRRFHTMRIGTRPLMRTLALAVRRTHRPRPAITQAGALLAGLLRTPGRL